MFTHKLLLCIKKEIYNLSTVLMEIGDWTQNNTEDFFLASVSKLSYRVRPK